MSKFRESELTENLKEFEENSEVQLEFERSIDGTMILEEANIDYDSKYGFININSKNGTFKINTTQVYGYEKKKSVIEIDIDALIVRIRKK